MLFDMVRPGWTWMIGCNLVFALLSLGCSDSNFVVKSPDESRRIAVTFNADTVRVRPSLLEDARYVDAGEVVFNTTKTPPLAKALFVCWGDAENSMELLVPKSMVSKNTLNSNLFFVRTEHPLDQNLLPDILRFHRRGCFEIGLSVEKNFTIFPPQNGRILEANQ